MTSYLSKIRDIPIKGEAIVRIIDSKHGLVVEPSADSDLLVSTLTQILIFKKGVNRSSTILDKESVQKIEIIEQRKKIPLLTMISFLVCSVIVYLGSSYWLVDNIAQPIVPGVNLALIPFLLLGSLIAGVAWMWKTYSFSNRITFRIVCTQGDVSVFNCAFEHRGDLMDNIVYFQPRVDI